MNRIIVAALAVLLGGWLLVDGVKAISRGDYTTFKTGGYPGQLGPWSNVVAAAGLNPRGMPIKVTHVVLGLLWMVGVVVLFTNPPIGRHILWGCSVGSLWYLPFGTLIGLAELALLYYSHRAS